MDEEDEGRRVAAEPGVRSRFLEPFNDIPEENEWRRRAPDGRNRVGFSWRADGKPGRTELEDAAVCSRVSFSSPRSFLRLSLSLFHCPLPVSTCLHTRARSCYIMRPNGIRVHRSIFIWLPEMRLTGPCGFARAIRKNIAREERSCILPSLADINAISALIDSICRETEER